MQQQQPENDLDQYLKQQKQQEERNKGFDDMGFGNMNANAGF